MWSENSMDLYYFQGTSYTDYTLHLVSCNVGNNNMCLHCVLYDMYKKGEKQIIVHGKNADSQQDCPSHRPITSRAL